MKKYCFYISVLLLFFSAAVCAQENDNVDKNAVEILNNASAKYSNKGDMEIKMKLIFKDEKTKNENSAQGILKNKKDKFVLETDFATMLFDGTDMYVYSDATEEITITRPEKAEVQNMDPVAVLNIYKDNFKIPAAKTIKTKQGECYSIDLFPEDLKADYIKLNILIAKADYSIKSVSNQAKNGVTNTIEIKSIETNKNYDDSIFTFDTAQFPQAVVIDLR